jgi:hypothetical protein
MTGGERFGSWLGDGSYKKVREHPLFYSRTILLRDSILCFGRKIGRVARSYPTVGYE